MFLGSSRPSTLCAHERRRDFHCFRRPDFGRAWLQLGCRPPWRQPGSPSWVETRLLRLLWIRCPKVVSTSVDVGSIVSWCETNEATTNSPFTHLRNRRTMHHRVFTAMLHKTSPAPTSCWRLETAALPFPALLSQRGLLGQEARIMCGVVKHQTEIVATAAFAAALRQQELEVGLAQKSEASSVQSPDDREVTVPIEDQILEAYDTCPAIGTVLESVLRGMHQVDLGCIPRSDVPLLTSVLGDSTPGRCAGTFGTTGTMSPRRSPEVRCDCPGVCCGWRYS